MVQKSKKKKKVEAAWKLPWLASMQIHLHHRPLGASSIAHHLLVQVVADQLLVTRVEPEPWWQCWFNVSQSHLSLYIYKKKVVEVMKEKATELELLRGGGLRTYI